MQLDEELGELALREHGLQEALQQHVHQPPVQLLVLEHVEDAQDAFTGGLRPDDVLQLVCAPETRTNRREKGGTGGAKLENVGHIRRKSHNHGKRRGVSNGTTLDNNTDTRHLSEINVALFSQNHSNML